MSAITWGEWEGIKEIACGKSSGKPFDGFQGTYENTQFSDIKEKLWRIVIWRIK